MAIAHNRLNNLKEKQLVAAFLQNIAAGMVTQKAAENAGFTTPQRDIARLMHSPEFAANVGKAIRHRVATTLAPQAMKVAEKLLNDSSVSPRVRWDIAKTMLAVGAGLVAPKPSEPDEAPKEISNMSGDDIMKLRESLQVEMANRMQGAKLIDHVHQGSANDSQQAQALDFLD